MDEFFFLNIVNPVTNLFPGERTYRTVQYMSENLPR